MISLTQISRFHISWYRSAVAAVVFGLALSAIRMHAQATPPSPPATQPSAQPGQEPEPAPDITLHSNVDEVSVDMVVHNKGNKLILDLKPEDLQVTDNGTPVQLTALHLERGDTTRGHLISMVFDPFTGPTAKSARQAAGKILKALPSKGYSIAVLDVRGRLRLIQGFTSDRLQITSAIETATASIPMHLESTLSKDISVVTDRAEPERTRVVQQTEKDLIAEVRTGTDTNGHRLKVTDRPYAKSLLDALLESQKTLQEKHGYLNLDALLALVHSQQKLSDRKAIIYFTHNVMMDSAAKERLKTIAADSTRAGVTIYTVDLDALNETGQYQLDNAMLNGKPPYNPTPQVVNGHGDLAVLPQQQGGYGIQGDPSPTGPQWGAKQDIEMMTDFTRRGPALSWDDIRSPMAQLSKNTGGIYFDAQGNIKKLLQQMVEDMSTYYTATYIPPIKEYDGSFRTIAVRPVRRGIRVQSKTGYFAVAPGTDESIRPFEVPLQKALSQPALPQDVSFRSSVLRFGDMPDGNTNSIVLEIPYSALKLKEDAHTNLYSAHVDVFAQIKDAKGEVVERFGNEITKRGALESLDRDPAAVVSFSRHFVADPGTYTLEVAVADRLSGKLGAQKSAFEIPPQMNSASISDMVLVRKLDRLTADQEDDLDPLHYAKDRVTPNISADLPRDARGISLFLVLHRDAASREPGLLEMQVEHNGVAGRRTPMPLSLIADQRTVPYLATFGKSGIAPGQYVIRTFFTNEGKTVEKDLAFHVSGDTATVAAKSSDAEMTAIAAPPEPKAPGELVITALTNRVPPLSPQDASLLIEDARDRALTYGESLPNFMCLEVTNRSLDPSGEGDWKLKDTIVTLLRYRDKHETRTTIEVNGETSSAKYNTMEGARSVGEFGGVLKSVFDKNSQAAFHWKETDELKDGMVQVFDYSVDLSHSRFSVVGTDGREITAGFHGQVFVDSATRSVRRVTMVADLPSNLPREFSTRATSLSVDYDYVSINNHDYLMPVSAEMRLVKGRHYTMLNTMEFRNYRRFGSNMRIVDFKPVDPQQK